MADNNSPVAIHNSNKRKYDAEESSLTLPPPSTKRRATGFYAPIFTHHPPPYNSVAAPVDEIPQAKQRAQETAARLCSVRRARVDTGADYDSGGRGFGSGHSCEICPDSISLLPLLNSINDVLNEAETGGSGTVSRRFAGQSGGEEFNLMVPNSKVGLIMGKAGETIKNMQTRTGACIKVLFGKLLNAAYKIGACIQKRTLFFVTFSFSHLTQVGEKPPIPVNKTFLKAGTPLQNVYFLFDKLRRDSGAYVISIAWGKTAQSLSTQNQNFGLSVNGLCVVIMSTCMLCIVIHSFWRYWQIVESPKVKFEFDQVIGVDRYGSIVYKETVSSSVCAIKRLSSKYFEYSAIRENMDCYVGKLNTLTTNAALYKVVEDSDYIYVSSELGLTDLNSIIEMTSIEESVTFNDIVDFKLRRSIRQQYPSDIVLHLMRDMIKGVNNLHQSDRCHGKLTPSNVLLFRKEKKIGEPGEVRGRLCAKLCDIGMTSKIFNKSLKDFIPSDLSLSKGWLLSDVLESIQPSQDSDIFSLGCLLYYCLTGVHPYGDVHERSASIINKSRITYADIAEVKEALDLLPKMLDIDRVIRGGTIKMTEVRCHPLFWKRKERIEFLATFSDQYSIGSRSVFSALQDLQKDKHTIFTPNKWSSLVDAPLLLAAKRTYREHLVGDLIRFIRNEYRHFAELGNVQHYLGSYPDDTYTYFEARFPMLLVATYNAAKMHCNQETWFKTAVPEL